jgi:hypothetical protein
LLIRERRPVSETTQKLTSTLRVHTSKFTNGWG